MYNWKTGIYNKWHIHRLKSTFRSFQNYSLERICLNCTFFLITMENFENLQKKKWLSGLTVCIYVEHIRTTHNELLQKKGKIKTTTNTTPNRVLFTQIRISVTILFTLTKIEMMNENEGPIKNSVFTKYYN